MTGQVRTAHVPAFDVCAILYAQSCRGMQGPYSVRIVEEQEALSTSGEYDSSLRDPVRSCRCRQEYRARSADSGQCLAPS